MKIALIVFFVLGLMGCQRGGSIAKSSQQIQTDKRMPAESLPEPGEFTEALDGSKFCRTVKSDGSFGQPAGSRLHCVSFNGGMMTDDGSTFFGNPPFSTSYQFVGDKFIVTYSDKGWPKIVYMKTAVGDSLSNSAGAILNKQ